MKVLSPFNIHAKSQVDRFTHNENLGEGSNEPPPPEAICLAKWLEGLRCKTRYQRNHTAHISGFKLATSTHVLSIRDAYRIIGTFNFLVLCLLVDVGARNNKTYFTLK